MQPGNEPVAKIIMRRDGYYFKLPEFNSEWIHLGIAPVPRNVRQTFIYHLCNGLLMQYPLWSVIRYAWRERHSFKKDTHG